MSDNIGTILAMAALVMMSAYFSATEMAFSSLNRTRIKSMAEYGSKPAQRVLDIYDDYDRLLSTLLVGNNIVNIGVASLGTVFFVRHFGEEYGASISTAVITIVVLIFGEISPKSIAKENPESFAMFVAPSVRFFMILLRPVNFIFAVWKRLLCSELYLCLHRYLPEIMLLGQIYIVQGIGLLKL